MRLEAVVILWGVVDLVQTQIQAFQIIAEAQNFDRVFELFLHVSFEAQAVVGQFEKVTLPVGSTPCIARLMHALQLFVLLALPR